jgi:hypothetical protein
MAKSGTFRKGNKGGPGRPPVLLPEVQRAIDANRNAVKVLILQKIGPALDRWVTRMVKDGAKDGDILKFKTLLELALGKLVEDAPEFPLTEEEKLLVLEWRRRKLALASGSTPIPD